MGRPRNGFPERFFLLPPWSWPGSLSSISASLLPCACLSSPGQRLLHRRGRICFGRTDRLGAPPRAYDPQNSAAKFRAAQGSAPASRPLPRRGHQYRRWMADWLPLFISLACNAAALFILWKAWPLAVSVPTLRFDEWTGGALIGLAFPALVLERRFAAQPEHKVLAAPFLTRLLRVLLFELLGLALGYLLFGLGIGRAPAVLRGVLIFTALVACEFLLRDLFPISSCRLPAMENRPGPCRQHRGFGCAAMAAAQHQGHECRDQQAIRTSIWGEAGPWAFMRRASDAGAGWPGRFCLAVIRAFRPRPRPARGLRKPSADRRRCFHSGLHVYLPWPFGRAAARSNMGGARDSRSSSPRRTALPPAAEATAHQPRKLSRVRRRPPPTGCGKPRIPRRRTIWWPATATAARISRS